LIIIHGIYGSGKRRVAKALEESLFCAGYNAYYFGISNYFEELDHDVRKRDRGREEHLERLGDLARVMTDAGTLLITTVADADDYDFERLKMLNEPNEIFVVNVGENNFTNYPVDVLLEYRPDLPEAVATITATLRKQGVLLD
jgi:bifunctional enzyme CysN/CysC